MKNLDNQIEKSQPDRTPGRTEPLKISLGMAGWMAMLRGSDFTDEMRRPQ